MERSLTRIPPLHTIASSRVEREKFESRDCKNNKDNDIINNRVSRGGGLMMERNTNANATANTSSAGGARAGVGAAENSNSQRGSNLLERFRAIVRETEEEFNRPLREDQIVSLYKNAISELTFNSKLIITDLTIIAGEQSHAAKGIAAVVCARISEVLGELKVYTLYLLDSIVKNIGGDYVKYFEARLSEVFCESYTQVDEGSQRQMEHLFRTWGRVFHSAPLRIIEEDLQIPPDSPSSGTTSSRPPESQTQRPGHSIHVNPKYLEARQQFEQSSMVEGSNSEINEDSSSPEPERSGRSIHESPKRWPEDSRRLHKAHRPESADAFLEPGYGQKPATSYSDYDFSVSPSRIRLGRSLSPFSRMGVGKPSSPVSRLRGGRVASPPRVGIGRDPSPSSVGGRSAPLASSRVGVGRTPSPSRIVGRLNDRNAEHDNGWERPWAGKGDGDRLRQLDTANTSVAYGSRNGYDWRHQPMHGALIDAYGNYRGQRSSRGLLSHVQPPQEIDIISSRMVSRNWRNSEEEEYLWEDMSPRLENPCRGSDNPRKDDYFPGDLKKWSGLEREKRMGLEPALPDSDWQMHGPLSHMDRPMMSEKERRPPRREFEERQPSSLLQSGIVSQNIRDTSTETSSLLQSSQGALGHRPVMGRPPHLTHQNHSPTSQSRLKTLNVSVPGHSNSSSGLASSFNLTHSAGHPVASANEFRSAGTEMPLVMVQKSRTNAGSSLGSDPLSFEFLSPVTPSSSSVPFSQRQQSQRLASRSPITQSLRPSMQTMPPLPTSAPPLQQFQPLNHHHQTNFMKPGQSQVQLPSLHSQGHSSQSFQQPPLQSQPVQQIPQQLPQLQQVSQSQAAPELLNQLPHNLSQGNQIPQQLPIPQEVQPILRTPFQQITSSQALTQSQPPQQSQLSYGASQTMGSAMSSSVANPNSGLASRPALLPVVPNNLSSQVLGGVQPPLPPGPPPASLLVASTSQTSQLTTSNTTLPSSIGNVSSLLRSLIAQGVLCAETPATSSSCPSIPVSSAAIPNQFPDNNAAVPAVSTTASLFPAPSLNATPPKSVPAEALSAAQDMIGTQFSSDILKVRHEFVLSALYEDLPRQCTTCGLRFKFQEEHSNHMDWHVSRNRTVSKSRKQKTPQSVSRKWFLSAKEWLSGTEVSTSEVVPTFSPVETTSDKKDSEEVAVPADDKQSVCVLCGDLFDYFYSDERDEWMYKGAVYMQAPSGSTEGIDGSKLGSIVHAKCRSESVGASFAESEEDEQDGIDDSGNRRKRIRC